MFLFFLTFINFLRDRVRVGEGQRERETQNLKQAPGFELSAQSLRWGSNSQTARSWPELKWDTYRLSHPGALENVFKMLYSLDSDKKNSRFILRETAWAGEEQREMGQKIRSGLCPDSREPNVELEHTNHQITTWAEVRCLTKWATQVPLKI